VGARARACECLEADFCTINEYMYDMVDGTSIERSLGWTLAAVPERERERER
jgi:hypothetical protein